MVIEIAQFDIRSGSEDDFIAAYREARDLIAVTPGCRSIRMTRGVESPRRFVLLVEWDTLDAHLKDFRESERFPRWRALIGPYFAEAPTMEHVAEV